MADYFPRTADDIEKGLWHRLPPITCQKSNHAKAWLDIAVSMQAKPEFYWGWYCTSCTAILGTKGQR